MYNDLSLANAVTASSYLARSFVERGCRLLDSENYAAWLADCSERFRYRIQAYSHEIRREMIWLDKDKASLALLFEQLPMHERYKGNFRRLLGWTDVVQHEASGGVVTESGFSVYHVDLHGESRLYCTGRYRDELDIEDRGCRLRSRTVLMDTRRLPFASHVPI